MRLATSRAHQSVSQEVKCWDEALGLGHCVSSKVVLPWFSLLHTVQYIHTAYPSRTRYPCKNKPVVFIQNLSLLDSVSTEASPSGLLLDRWMFCCWILTFSPNPWFTHTVFLDIIFSEFSRHWTVKLLVPIYIYRDLEHNGAWIPSFGKSLTSLSSRRHNSEIDYSPLLGLLSHIRRVSNYRLRSWLFLLSTKRTNRKRYLAA